MDFKLPDLGEGVKEGQIVRLMIAEGDRISEDQPLMEVETDKAAVVIPSPYSGVVQKLHVTEQQIVNVGDVMVTFDTSASPTAAPAKPLAASRSSSTSPTTAATAVAKRASGTTKPASPAVRKLARTLGIDLNSLEGSGPGGRVLRADVEWGTHLPWGTHL